MVSLDYAVPSSGGCPEEESFRRKVISHLHYDPFQPDAAVRVRVQVALADRGMTGRLEWEDGVGEVRGEQVFARRNRSCVQLVDEMTFALAVQIDLLGASAASSRPRPPQDSAPPAPAAPGAAPPPAPPSEGARLQASVPEAPPPPPPSARWAVTVGGGTAFDLWLAPRVTGSAHLFVELRHGRVSAQLGGGASLPTTTYVQDSSGFRANSASGELGLCGHLDPFAICGLGEMGWLWVQGFGVDHPASPSGFVARAGVRLGVSQRLSDHLRASLRADGLVLLTPWTVDLNRIAVWAVPIFGAALGVDLAARFP